MYVFFSKQSFDFVAILLIARRICYVKLRIADATNIKAFLILIYSQRTDTISDYYLQLRKNNKRFNKFLHINQTSNKTIRITER